MRVAAIGIGSNSLRMLIADIQDGKLQRVLRDRAGMRVFASLDENRRISQEMILNACQSVSAMIAKARAQGAERMHLFATSAVRDASNRAEFCARLQAATGLEPCVCSGEEEAALSFLGASDSQERCGVIDIGGGSTEICLGRGDEIAFSRSLQMGAVRLFREHPIHDVHDALVVCDGAQAMLESLRGEVLAAAPVREWFGVGGTFTNSAALIQNIAWTSKSSIHGYRIAPAQVEAAIAVLAPMSMESRLRLPSLQPQRADIVVHGMAILLGCMRSLQIDKITVSEYGNLEGYLKREYGAS